MQLSNIFLILLFIINLIFKMIPYLYIFPSYLISLLRHLALYQFSWNKHSLWCLWMIQNITNICLGIFRNEYLDSLYNSFYCTNCYYFWHIMYELFWITKSNQILEHDLTSTNEQMKIHLSTDFFLPFELSSVILLCFVWLVDLDIDGFKLFVFR